MDHHHKIIGCLFAYTSTAVINTCSSVILDYNNTRPFGRLDKFYVSSVIGLLLALLQLITSARLTVKGEFLNLWSRIHIGIAVGYSIIFTVLILGDIARYRYTDPYSRNFLLLVPICVFNLIHYKKTGCPIQRSPNLIEPQ